MFYNIYKKLLLIFLFLLLMLPLNCSVDQAPKLTVVIVIDQCAYHYFPKLRNNFKYGFKNLFQNGMVYTNAFHPHGVPETAPGHHGISTGCYPKDHGAVVNQWINNAGKKVNFEEDSNNIKSGHNCMVDNLSDQFLQFDSIKNKTKVFALSIKSYPAIAMAGKMGKALWFDENLGTFGSSNKYFEKLPEWVEIFNKKTLQSFSNYQWKTTYKLNAPEYNYPFINNYEFTGASESYIGKFPLKINPKNAKRYFTLIRTPFANSMIINLAKMCINQNLDLQTNDRLLLWVSLSQLDILTHLFGPDSLETIDTLYQLDRQLKDFITFLQSKVGASNCLIVLTADHGIAPIPEIQQKKGIPSAQRIMASKLIKTMNLAVKSKLNIPNIVKEFEPNSFWLNHDIYSKLSHAKQTKVLDTLIALLKHYPGIKDAWTYQELSSKDVRYQQSARYYKMQLFPGRVGEIICQPAPYCQITHYATGTSHCTPYNYDTHVPLVLYQPNKLQARIIPEKVLIPQLPVTLAKLLHITKPSASGFNVLPGF